VSVMRLVVRKEKFDRLATWTCCDQKWELLLCRKFPKRWNYKPTCPSCGKTGLSYRQQERR